MRVWGGEAGKKISAIERRSNRDRKSMRNILGIREIKIHNRIVYKATIWNGI